MALELAKAMKTKLNLSPKYAVQSNAVFVVMKNDIVDALNKHFKVVVWNRGAEFSIVRFMTSYNTTHEKIQDVIDFLEPMFHT